MRIVSAIAIGAVLIAWVFLFAMNGMVSLHLYLAAALGIGASILLAGALMGLMFMSSGTDHDTAVDNWLPDHDRD